MIYITGDPHAKFENIRQFSKERKTSRDDIMIILGDTAVNISTEERNRQKKEELSEIPLTFFCIHGNHDRRPGTLPGYVLKEWHGGKVGMEPKYPSILYAKDAEVFDLDGIRTIVIGGAYSANKEERIKAGKHWFADEQPSDEIKRELERKLEEFHWNIDVVLSHTLPYKYKPVDSYRHKIDGAGVDESTELWLGQIEEKLDYQWWYAGHFHIERTVDKVQIMFKNIEPFGSSLLKDKKNRIG